MGVPIPSPDDGPWTTSFVSTRERAVRCDHYPGDCAFHVGVDIRHEVRYDEVDPNEDWLPAAVYEARPHGINKIEPSEEWWT